MKNSLTRTSILLPQPLLQQLKVSASQNQTTVSELIRELLEYAVSQQHTSQISHTYHELSKLDGAIHSADSDTSSSVDEILYGESGSWRGSEND